MSVKIIVCGARGKMGREVISLAQEEESWELVGAIESPTHPEVGKEIGKGLKITSNLEQVIDKDCVVVEFTTPEATIEHLKIAKQNKSGMVIGTTGFKDFQLKEIKEAAQSIPILLSPNMSLGINLFFALVKEMARILKDFDKEVIELHHRLKQDAPSGTALKIAEILAEVENKELSQIAVYGRKGSTGKRKKEEIGIHSLRGGTVVGEHTVIFAGENERLQITHIAESRRIFARGALVGAKFIAQKNKGLYDLQDVLGIKK